MSGRVRRLAAVFTVASASLAIAAFATPEASSSPCQAIGSGTRRSTSARPRRLRHRQP